MSCYTTTLTLPRFGAPSHLVVVPEIAAALARDGRAEGAELEQPLQGQEAHHINITVRFSAVSERAAHCLAADLHEIALQRVLALAAPENHDVGWTSGFSHPEVVSG